LTRARLSFVASGRLTRVETDRATPDRVPRWSRGLEALVRRGPLWSDPRRDETRRDAS
jgi:hypothetical protein